MENLNTQYSHFPGETLHLECIFPNYLFPIHQLTNLIQYFYPEPRLTLKTNRKKASVGFFLIHNSKKT